MFLLQFGNMISSRYLPRRPRPVPMYSRSLPLKCCSIYFSGFQSTVLPLMDYSPDAEAEIVKSLGGYDALIWNTKFRLTGELLDLASMSI